MAFLIAAGFASSNTSVLSSTETGLPRAQRPPQMRQLGISPSYDGLLTRISTALCDNATTRHLLDLSRIDRRLQMESQLQETLTDLKHKMARKAAASIPPVSVDSSVELYYRAS
jgi:hypothetical protein